MLILAADFRDFWRGITTARSTRQISTPRMVIHSPGCHLCKEGNGCTQMYLIDTLQIISEWVFTKSDIGGTFQARLCHCHIAPHPVLFRFLLSQKDGITRLRLIWFVMTHAPSSWNLIYSRMTAVIRLIGSEINSRSVSNCRRLATLRRKLTNG